MAKSGSTRKNRTKQTRPPQVVLPGIDFIAELQDEILGWYEASGRDLPWRRTRYPYAMLVSELMLQQTQAPRVIPKYKLFLGRFPSVAPLAEAPLGDVLTLWSGLGYNRRAQHLHRTARLIDEELEGNFPRSEEELRRLPGIGTYTAGAIVAFAHNADAIILETNIRRIYQLLLSGEDDSDMTNLSIGEALLPKGRSRDWYHALMDLGTMVRSKNSAREQQELLREMFPLLSEHAFPVFEAGRLKRPQQTPFAGSIRYFRGQILKRLQAGSAPLPALSADLDEEKFSTALEALLKEGLIQREPFQDVYRLP